MYKTRKFFYKFLLTLSVVLLAGNVAVAEQAPNPRSATQKARDNRDVQTVSEKNISRSTVRHVVPDVGRAESAVVGRRGTSARTAVRKAVVPGKVPNTERGGASTARVVSTPLSRSAVRSAVVVANGESGGRSSVAKKIRKAPLVRASVARATALFDDVSKIGGGYSECRDAYATCMDQFCGKANETYRRCFCSSRFTDFRNTEEALDQAKVLLQSFEDNNLNAVDKTAAEVGAMYTATVGEAAIKNDTSGAQSILNEIGDLLAGKRKTTTSAASSSTSLGVLSLDFSTSVDDIWGGGDVFGDSGSSIFSSGGGQDVSGLEGEALYKAVDQQCRAMVAKNCESEAAFNMSKSSYGILITQDCNAYEKSLNSKREQVKATVRQAEKILRQARLEDYRAHNSQDVNECLDRVRSAMLVDTACGKGYRRCLDYTGAYINQQTGDPIYSQRLFQLTNLIKLDGESSDVLTTQNSEFNKFLDSRKMFANQALDTCRDISDTVWTEFKRAALIEIAQAQDEKIEQVKGTCVSTMAECYDTNTNQLKETDTTKAQASGAAVAYAAKQMCEDKVIACASLYGDNSNCKFDGNGRLVDENGNVPADRCGLTELLAFVDMVDNVRIAEGCADALTNYVQTLCAPTAGDTGKSFPWGCRKLSLDGKDGVKEKIVDFAVRNCADPDNKGEITGTTDEKLNTLGEQAAEVKETINRTLDSIRESISTMMRDECYAVKDDGVVVFDETGGTFAAMANPEVSISPTWLKNVFGSTAELKQLADTGIYGYKLIMESGARNGDSVTTSAQGSNRSLGYGVCTIPSVQQLCNMQNQLPNVGEGAAKYDAEKRTCTLETDWYEYRCRIAGGYYVGDEEKGNCYLKQ